MNLRRMNFFFYYLTFATIIAVSAGRGDWLNYYRLSKYGVEAKGTVTATDCAGSKSVSYRFAAGGKEFTGKGSGNFGNPECTALKPGDPLSVTYLPADPQSNLPGNQSERLTKESTGIAMAAIFIPLVILLAIFLIMRKFRSSSPR